MAFAHWAVRVAEDARLTAPHIRVAISVARDADENGIAADSSVRNISNKLDLGESTTFRALHQLDKFGYIEWTKATMPERFAGRVGRIRLILSDAKSE